MAKHIVNLNRFAHYKGRQIVGIGNLANPVNRLRPGRLRAAQGQQAQNDGRRLLVIAQQQRPRQLAQLLLPFGSTKQAFQKEVQFPRHQGVGQILCLTLLHTRHLAQFVCEVPQVPKAFGRKQIGVRVGDDHELIATEHGLAFLVSQEVRVVDCIERLDGLIEIESRCRTDSQRRRGNGSQQDRQSVADHNLGDSPQANRVPGVRHMSLCIA